MKNVMTRAWEIVREKSLNIKFALIEAWKEVKNNVSKIDFANIKSLRVWENYGKVRLYLEVNGISAYQHRKGSVYIELINGVWKGTSVTKDWCRELLETIQGKNAQDIKAEFNK